MEGIKQHIGPHYSLARFMTSIEVAESTRCGLAPFEEYAVILRTISPAITGLFYLVIGQTFFERCLSNSLHISR